MKLNVAIDGAVLPFEWFEDGDQVRFRLDGNEEHRGSLVEVEPGIYSVLLGDRSFEVKVVTGAQGCLYVDVGRRHLAVGVIDPRLSPTGARGTRRDGPQHLLAPMPGRIVRLLAAEGDDVRAGQGLIVVEAMKMQNEMKSPKDGKLIKVNVSEGDTVAAGDILAIVD